MDTLLTREMMINSPKHRRRSSTFIDAVHDIRPQKETVAPAQLYSTLSGRLFHAGAIIIVLVGLPARGKTHISVALARYLGWLGVKTRTFHLSDYRRATLGPGIDAPADYFYKDPSPSSQLLRQRILKKCREDIFKFLNNEHGQVAIYDGSNPLARDRLTLARELEKFNFKTLFLESYVDDQDLLNENVRNVKLSSPDFANIDPQVATKMYLDRIQRSIPVFESMSIEEDLPWIRVTNAGQRIETHDKGFTFIHKLIILYLMNMLNKSKKIFFARAGMSDSVHDAFLSDAPLSEDGVRYAKLLAETLMSHRKEEYEAEVQDMEVKKEMKEMEVWTSLRNRTIETAQFFDGPGYYVTQRQQLSQMNPGVLERLTMEELREQYPGEIEKHATDPYHHRYPRAESYHDVAVRMEPIIFELERSPKDVLIIAHESVLRVIYGYMMACDAGDIPILKFPRNEIVEIVPGSYSNEAKRIIIPGLPVEEHDIASPGELNIPICHTPSEVGTPLSDMGSPALGSPGIGSPAVGRNLATEVLRKHHAEMISRLSIEDELAGSEPLNRTVILEDQVVAEPESIEDGDAAKDGDNAVDDDVDKGRLASFSG